MKTLTVLSLFMLQCVSALGAGPMLTDGKFPEDEFGNAVVFPLSAAQRKQTQGLTPESWLIKLQLTGEQITQIQREAGLTIDFVKVFDGKSGYNDCTCFGYPQNLGAIIDGDRVQLPYNFIEDDLLHKLSEENAAKRFLLIPGLDENGNALPAPKPDPITLFTGEVGGVPVSFEITIPADKTKLIRGEYKYLSGELTGTSYTLLGEQSPTDVITLREYTKSRNWGNTHLRHTADFKLTRKNTILGDAKLVGSLNNVDGNTFKASLKENK